MPESFSSKLKLLMILSENQSGGDFLNAGFTKLAIVLDGIEAHYGRNFSRELRSIRPIEFFVSNRNNVFLQLECQIVLFANKIC